MVTNAVLEKRKKIFGCERGREVSFHELVQLVSDNRREVVSGAQ